MAQPSRADVVIIGAGITGLSIGRELCRHKLRVVVVEKEADVAMGVSKTAGSLIYMGLFQAASLAIKDLSGRADLEAETGSERMGLLWQGFQDFHTLAHELDIDHKHSGVLLFARNRKEEAQLDNLARLCGHIPGGTLVELDRKALFQAEPNLTLEAQRGLLDTTGALSVFGPEYVIAVYENARANGLKVLLGAEFQGVEKIPGGLLVKTGRGDDQSPVRPQLWGQAGRSGRRPGGRFGRAGPGLEPLLLPQPGLGPGQEPGRNHPEHSRDSPHPGQDRLAVSSERREYSRLRGLLRSHRGSRLHRHHPPNTSRTESPGCGPWRPPFRPGTSSPATWGSGSSTTKTRTTTSSKARPATPPSSTSWSGCPGLPRPRPWPARWSGCWGSGGWTLIPKKRFVSRRQAIPRFRFLEAGERARLIARDPAYGRVVCRCETVTEGEIVEAIRRGATTIQGVQFRTRAGMGRCQRNFCGAKVADLLARELGQARSEVTFKGPGYELQEAGGGR